MFQHNQLNNERTSYALNFLRTLQRFASKTLQNDSKAVEKLQHHRICATCVLFESFCSQNVGKRSSETEFIIQKAFNGILQTSVGKWLKHYRKKSKMLKFLSITDKFSEVLFEIGKLR